MSLTFRQLTTHFAAEASPTDLREIRDRGALDQIRAGMDRYAVLVFRDQPLSDAEQLAFAERFEHLSQRARRAQLDHVRRPDPGEHKQRG